MGEGIDGMGTRVNTASAVILAIGGDRGSAFHNDTGGFIEAFDPVHGEWKGFAPPWAVDVDPWRHNTI